MYWRTAGQPLEPPPSSSGTDTSSRTRDRHRHGVASRCRPRRLDAKTPTSPGREPDDALRRRGRTSTTAAGVLQPGPAQLPGRAGEPRLQLAVTRAQLSVQRLYAGLDVVAAGRALSIGVASVHKLRWPRRSSRLLAFVPLTHSDAVTHPIATADVRRTAAESARQTRAVLVAIGDPDSDLSISAAVPSGRTLRVPGQVFGTGFGCSGLSFGSRCWPA
jgi:hypothetical protein